MAGNVSSSGKSAVRQQLEGRRRGLTSQQVESKSGEAQRHLAALPFFGAAKVVALYRGQSFEVSTAQLFEAVVARGATAVFPRVVRGEKVLSLHRVTTGLDFVPGPLGLLEPRDDLPRVQPAEVDLWVVPGVGFTREGARLGRGGGYYDATLAQARADARRVGLTFDCCLVDALPTEPHDLPVEAVASESGVRFAAGQPPRAAKTQL